MHLEITLLTRVTIALKVENGTHILGGKGVRGRL